MANEENLIPFKKGESGNPNGRPKGSKNLATIIRELENEDFDWSLVPIKQKDVAQKIGSPWKAIVHTAIAKAYAGDVNAMKWLSKAGYGDKLDVTSDGKQMTSGTKELADSFRKLLEEDDEKEETEGEAESQPEEDSSNPGIS